MHVADPAWRLAAHLRPARLRITCVPLACRGELAAARRTISRLRRGLLNTAERAALLRRLPRHRPPDEALFAVPCDRLSDPPCARKAYAPDPLGGGLRVDSMA